MRRKSSHMFLGASVKLVIIACAFLFAACGGSSGTNAVDEIMPAQDIGELSALEKTIYTESYAGYLVVHLNESTRTNDASKTLPLLCKHALSGVEGEGSGEVDRCLPHPTSPYKGEELLVNTPSILQPVITNHPTVALKRSISITPEQMDARREYLERISGKMLTDFNLIYHVEVSDPDEAVRTMRDLSSTAGVDKVYPKRKGYVTTLATVPDLTGQQGYLYANETHGGLNAQAAWDAGARGEGVVVVDGEYEWNYDHEDLPLDWPTSNLLAVPVCYPVIYPWCTGDFAHGTAVAGIVAAIDNGHGITGFAPQVDFKTGGGSDASFSILVDGEETRTNPELPPGSIITVEVQHAGRLSPDGFCSGFSEAGQYGCVPKETDPEFFASVEMAAAAGATVVEGSGNGSVDLADSATYWPYEITLYDHDSGSIIVGGSQGSNHQKISFSNFGSPVRAYAWAQSIVTTAYPYGGSTGPYYWTPGAGPNPPNDDPNAYYTNRFGGTSSATAMVAGAAAQLQSYAKNVTGEPTRYLMPLKLREILTSTGVAQSGGGGTIGKQPRLDQAMSAVDTFWSTISSSYPELVSGRLTEAEMLALRGLGLGIMCGHLDAETHEIVGPNDPACPDINLWPPGTKIAKSLDFDGDGRADLISWTNGQWKVDLSSVGSSDDNYGAWDLILNYTPIAGRWVWPYVEDYNSDGREDFAVYDKEHGKWYIAFTDSTLLGTGTWHGWDWIIDYSAEWVDTLAMNPWNSNYSRPAPGDYDGDGWMDIAIACSDGYWRIDYGGADISDYGAFDQNVQYLTGERLGAAPGWAYLTTIAKTPSGRNMYIAYKVPDGVADEGRMVVTLPEDGTNFDLFETVTARFGGNGSIPILSRFDSGSYFDIGLKTASGNWELSYDSPSFHEVIDEPHPELIYGGLNCRPVVGDFDGDDIDDRAVMCPNEWRIAYSGDEFEDTKGPDDARHIPLTYNSGKFTLPGRSYSGGVSYTLVQQLIAYVKEVNPTQPPPIPVDMVTVSVCQISGSDECR